MKTNIPKALRVLVAGSGICLCLSLACGKNPKFDPENPPTGEDIARGAVPALLLALKSSDPVIQENSASCLGVLGDAHLAQRFAGEIAKWEKEAERANGTPKIVDVVFFVYIGDYISAMTAQTCLQLEREVPSQVAASDLAPEGTVSCQHSRAALALVLRAMEEYAEDAQENIDAIGLFLRHADIEYRLSLSRDQWPEDCRAQLDVLERNKRAYVRDLGKEQYRQLVERARWGLPVTDELPANAVQEIREREQALRDAGPKDPIPHPPLSIGGTVQLPIRPEISERLDSRFSLKFTPVVRTQVRTALLHLATHEVPNVRKAAKVALDRIGVPEVTGREE